MPDGKIRFLQKNTPGNTPKFRADREPKKKKGLYQYIIPTLILVISGYRLLIFLKQQPSVGKLFLFFIWSERQDLNLDPFFFYILILLLGYFLIDL